VTRPEQPIRNAAIAVSDLRKSFGRAPVLDGISLTAAQGSLTAILGASGSGKTTLLRVIAGLERPDGGTISLAGRVVDGERTHMPPERRRIGYVPQEGSLFPHLSVAANIGFGLRGGLERRSPDRESRVAELLEMIGLAGFERRLPHHLSGGERQRVAVARALANRPDIILLDEPFSSLDVELRTSIRHDVMELLRQTGTTVILVTHDQDEALSSADRVAILRHGRIVQVDEPGALYRRPVDADVARFVGRANLLFGRLENGRVQSVLGPLAVELDTPAHEPAAVGVLVRPEQIVLSADDKENAASAACGVVVRREFHGHDVLLAIELDQPAWGLTPTGARGGWQILASIHGPNAPGLGQRVAVAVRGTATAWLTAPE
jgi:iron(III) transport system ATP-binding protein